jgi:signal transduction histidine kinase
LVLALFLLRRLTRPLERLAQRMSDYQRVPPVSAQSTAQSTAHSTAQPAALPAAQSAARSAASPAALSPALSLAPLAAQPALARAGALALAPAAQPAPSAAPAEPANEVQTIDRAFAAMTARLEAQAEQERQQAQDHRETMASVAHDLRTPLTALHGHLEALVPCRIADRDRERLLQAALAQSNKVRRLSQQLFELAALQSSHQLVQRERFSIDELVTDAVQKFELTSNIQSQPEDTQGAPSAAPVCAVTLGGEPPGRLELEGDIQLIERALTNLIDNALRHAAGTCPVRVSLHREGAAAHIVVEDGGPGLPAELLRRLHTGQSVREPPVRRSGGGIGGLGLAIAQRVAVLHGGSLKPLPTPQGGTRLCLALPLAG